MHQCSMGEYLFEIIIEKSFNTEFGEIQYRINNCLFLPKYEQYYKFK